MDTSSASKETTIPKIKAPRIRATGRSKSFPTVFVSGGTPIIVMPDGSLLPGQIDLKITIDQPLETLGKLPVVTATVTMLVNLADSEFIAESK